MKKQLNEVQKLQKIAGLKKEKNDTELSLKEQFLILIKVWERIPLGIRMNNGGMDREIPKELIEKLDRLGYKICKK